jgi:hypothetical protein
MDLLQCSFERIHSEKPVCFDISISVVYALLMSNVGLTRGTTNCAVISATEHRWLILAAAAAVVAAVAAAIAVTSAAHAAATRSECLLTAVNRTTA